MHVEQYWSGRWIPREKPHWRSKSFEICDPTKNTKSIQIVNKSENLRISKKQFKQYRSNRWIRNKNYTIDPQNNKYNSAKETLEFL